jgi:hypothetical protein
MTEHAPVHQAWAAVQADIKAVGKDGRNQSQSYNFRGIDGVMNAVGPILRKHGVFVTPTLVARDVSTVEVGKNRTPMRVVDVTVDYTVRGPAGDSFVGTTPGEAMDSGDKATSKAMSVAFRTFLIQGLTLPTHEVDPDATAYERSPQELERPVTRTTSRTEDEWQTPDLRAQVVAATIGKFADRQEFEIAFRSAVGASFDTADDDSLRRFLAHLEVAA